MIIPFTFIYVSFTDCYLHFLYVCRCFHWRYVCCHSHHIAFCIIVSFNFSFEQCRHLKLILDHMELSRIGSDFFRPDIQVRGLVVEQVYHLELGRSPPRVQTELQDEYLIAFPSESLIIGKGPFKYCVIKRIGWVG